MQDLTSKLLWLNFLVAQAVRDGRIWDLARMRSRQHPALKKAWEFIEKQQNQWIICQNISNQGGWMYDNGIEKSDPRIIKSLENLHQIGNIPLMKNASFFTVHLAHGEII